jgi:hypothetical protein
MQIKSRLTRFDSARFTPQSIVLVMFIFGALVLVGVAAIIWYDMTVWGKDIGTILLGSRTNEPLSLGIGATLIHYCLIGAVLIAAGLILVLKNRITATEAKATLINALKASNDIEPEVEEQSKQQETADYILDIVSRKHPESVGQLLKLVSQEHSVSKNEIMDSIILLQKQGKLTFVDRSAPPLTPKQWFFSPETGWFWIVTIISLISATILLTFTEQVSSFYYVRPLFLSVFVLYLPGYSFIKALFSKNELNSIERILLSIVTSVSLVLAIALILNYTPWGIRLVPITVSLLVVTLSFSIIALTREYRRKFRKNPWAV